MSIEEPLNEHCTLNIDYGILIDSSALITHNSLFRSQTLHRVGNRCLYRLETYSDQCDE